MHVEDTSAPPLTAQLTSHTVAGGEVPGTMILGGRGPTQLSSWQKSGSAGFAP